MVVGQHTCAVCMLSSAALRPTAAVRHLPAALCIRHRSSLPDRTTAAVASSSITTRFTTMAEVCVSKIGPAGAGWWASNAFAADAGFASTDVGYFLLTGAGDSSAVLLGQSVSFTSHPQTRPSMTRYKLVP